MYIYRLLLKVVIQHYVSINQQAHQYRKDRSPMRSSLRRYHFETAPGRVVSAPSWPSSRRTRWHYVWVKVFEMNKTQAVYMILWTIFSAKWEHNHEELRAKGFTQVTGSFAGLDLPCPCGWLIHWCFGAKRFSHKLPLSGALSVDHAFKFDVVTIRNIHSIVL